MATNPDARKCAATTAAGRPCRAWAMHDSDPPICNIHAGTAKAPTSNDNAKTHGFYSRAYTDQEIADLITYAIDETLDDEIAVTRVALRRVFTLLKLANLEPKEYTHLASLAFVGARTVGRLLRDKRALSGEAADGLTTTLTAALDELATELGIDV